MQELSRRVCSPIGLVSPSHTTLTVISIPSLPLRGNLYRNILPFIGDPATHTWRSVAFPPHWNRFLLLHTGIISSLGWQTGSSLRNRRQQLLYERNFQRLVHGDVHGLIHDVKVFARAGRRMISRIDSRFRAFAHAGYPLWRALYSQKGFLPFGATSWHTWTFQRDFRGILRPSSVRASYHLEQRRGILGPSLFPQEG